MVGVAVAVVVVVAVGAVVGVTVGVGVTVAVGATVGVAVGVMGMRTSPTGWFVFDENPADRPGPTLTGPFPTRDEALEWANLQSPDDGDGDAIVLRAKEPE